MPYAPERATGICMYVCIICMFLPPIKCQGSYVETSITPDIRGRGLIGLWLYKENKVRD
jgi:hypothetical protein